jgi:hypothetical protein
MRFHGAVGYATDEETSPGVWTETITEKEYYGDIIRHTRRLEASSPVLPTLNANLKFDNLFSILADAFAYENFEKMRYVNWNGSNWTVTAVEVRRPRLILTMGDLWNGNTA